jgi:hypothetical protein
MAFSLTHGRWPGHLSPVKHMICRLQQRSILSVRRDWVPRNGLCFRLLYGLSNERKTIFLLFLLLHLASADLSAFRFQQPQQKEENKPGQIRARRHGSQRRTGMTVEAAPELNPSRPKRGQVSDHAPIDNLTKQT